MSITLTPEVADRIRQKIETGPYRTADEVIEEALSLLDERERVQTLRAKLQIGIDQLDRGEGEERTPELMERLSREADEMFRRGELPDPDVCP
jgi:antitoxin ParD1/3/4